MIDRRVLFDAIAYLDLVYESLSVLKFEKAKLYIIRGIGIVAIRTLGTQVLPNKERNLSIRNQKVFKY